MKALENDLDSLNNEIKKHASSSLVVDFVYQHQINYLKGSIYEWEQRYETDTNEIEIELAKLQNSLDKANDQVASLEAEIYVFRRRVNEALEIERQLEENARLLSTAVSIYRSITSKYICLLFFSYIERTKKKEKYT